MVFGPSLRNGDVRFIPAIITRLVASDEKDRLTRLVESEEYSPGIAANLDCLPHGMLRTADQSDRKGRPEGRWPPAAKRPILAGMRKPVPIRPADDPESAAKRAAIREGLAELDAGRYIPHEEMRRWLLSWATENELPPPDECK